MGGEGELPDGFHWYLPKARALKPLLKVVVGGLFRLLLGILHPLQLNSGRDRHILKVPPEAVLVSAACNAVHTSKDVQMQTADDIIWIVVVWHRERPPQRHLVSLLSFRSAYIARTKEALVDHHPIG
jgi:hypothetical protein